MSEWEPKPIQTASKAGTITGHIKNAGQMVIEGTINSADALMAFVQTSYRAFFAPPFRAAEMKLEKVTIASDMPADPEAEVVKEYERLSKYPAARELAEGKWRDTHDGRKPSVYELAGAQGGYSHAQAHRIIKAANAIRSPRTRPQRKRQHRGKIDTP